ncbi:MAG: AsnC family transcriptional regulator [Candidatus Bathyarchaeota archaeon]|nr:AsnC family transcriptional regulator [Candidatus Bathyarchaeota archaeon]
MDDIDVRIIEFLTHDSRASFRKIAKETGLSTDTVMRRFQKLEENEVIQPIITVDPTKLGYEAFVFYGLKVASQGGLRQVTEKVAEIPDITAVMETTGEYDLTVIGVVRNIKHIFQIGEEIAKVQGIRKIIIDRISLPPASVTARYPPAPWHNLHIKTP